MQGDRLTVQLVAAPFSYGISIEALSLLALHVQG
jgi:hypothetical protein